MISTSSFSSLQHFLLTVCCLVLFSTLSLAFSLQTGPSLTSSSSSSYTSRHQCTGYHDRRNAPSSYSYRGRRNRPSFQLHVVEHAVDCTQNPIIAQLYGENSEQCFNTGFHFFSNLGGALNEAITIGFFIVATILVNRSKNSLGNFNIYDYDGM